MPGSTADCQHSPPELAAGVPQEMQTIQFHRTFKNGFISEIVLYFLSK